MNDVLILIPAAGRSARMRGRDKLLEEVDGEPILLRQVRRALAAGAPVMVTISKDFPKRANALDGISDKGLTVRDALDGTEGMAVSIRAGAAAAGAARGLMILLADMPEITTEDIGRMLEAFEDAPEDVHRATSADGRPGHPVIFPRRLFDRLSRVTGDQGARALLRDEKLRLSALPDQHAITDLDTPEAWSSWRKNRNVSRQDP